MLKFFDNLPKSTEPSTRWSWLYTGRRRRRCAVLSINILPGIWSICAWCFVSTDRCAQCYDGVTIILHMNFVCLQWRGICSIQKLFMLVQFCAKFKLQNLNRNPWENGLGDVSNTSISHTSRWHFTYNLRRFAYKIRRCAYFLPFRNFVYHFAYFLNFRILFAKWT